MIDYSRVIPDAWQDSIDDDDSFVKEESTILLGHFGPQPLLHNI
jgi:hypothetical protein